MVNLLDRWYLILDLINQPIPAFDPLQFHWLTSVLDVSLGEKDSVKL